MAKRGHSKQEIWIQLTSERLKELRKEAGYSSYETFATENDLDRKQYWRVENGLNITIRTLTKILGIHKKPLFVNGKALSFARNQIGMQLFNQLQPLVGRKRVHHFIR